MAMVAFRKSAERDYQQSELISSGTFDSRMLRVISETNVSLETATDPVLASLLAEPKIVDEQDAMILALDLGHKIRRRASDAIAAQANQDPQTIKSMLG